MEEESAMWFGFAAITVYNAVIRTGFASDSYGFSTKVDITVTITSIGSRQDNNYIFRKGGIDGFLYSIEGVFSRAILAWITYNRVAGAGGGSSMLRPSFSAGLPK